MRTGRPLPGQIRNRTHDTLQRFSLKCQVAGEIKNFNPLEFVDSRFARRFDRFIHFAVAAAKWLWRIPDWVATIATRPEGVIIGTSVGAHNYFKPVYNSGTGPELDKAPPFMIMNAAGNLVAGVTAIEFGARGPHHCVMDACASGTNALGLALMPFEAENPADIMIAGGSEAPVVESLMASLDGTGRHVLQTQ